MKPFATTRNEDEIETTSEDFDENLLAEKLMPTNSGPKVITENIEVIDTPEVRKWFEFIDHTDPLQSTFKCRHDHN